MTHNRVFSLLRISTAKSPITLVNQVSRFCVGAILAISIAIVIAAASTSTAFTQTVTYTGAAVNFGAVNVCPSGKSTPAPCSKTVTLTYNVTASGNLGTPQALTTGVPNLDYKLASGSTCTGSVTQGNTCKVNVTFAPIAPGARNGAVEIVDTSGDVLATTYIYGTGTGPAVAFFTPGASIQLGSGFSGPFGVAVDASGNIFVADYYHSRLKEILAAGGYTTSHIVGRGFYFPTGVAVDGAGNVFVAQVGDGLTVGPAVKEVLRAGGYATINTLGSGFNNPEGVAVDGSGNVFVGDTFNSAVKEVLRAGGYTTVNTLGSGFTFPEGLAVDASGNVFVADYYAVKEITAASGYTTVKTLGGSSSSYQPDGVAVDASGNIYVASGCCISEILAAGDYTMVNTLSSPYDGPFGIAVDANGNIFYSANGEPSSSITEFPRSQPPLFAFGSTELGATSPPLSTAVQNVGNTNLVGTSLTVSPEWNKIAGSGTPEDCTASFSLVPGTACNLSIIFEPTEIGSLTGAVTLTDNALNETDASQAIALSGTGAKPVPPVITSLNTTYAAPYSVVVLNGTKFGPLQESSTVTFNGIPTPHYAWAATRIYVTVPPNATTGNLVVTVDGQPSKGIPFTIVPQPTVTGISPTSGPVGTIVTISGTNLVDYENKGTVTFGIPLPILSQSSTALKVAVPPGSTFGQFHVLVNDTGINTSTFFVTQ
jgi:sugar lactone lactonase YvrE